MRSGALRSVCHGWYAAADAHQGAARAIQLGGRLGCVSAVGLHGLWVPPERQVTHVRLLARSRTARPRLPGIRWCPAHGSRAVADHGIVDPLPIALASAARCVTAEHFVAILDSALHRRLCTVADLQDWLALCPLTVRRLIDRTGPAESGSESLVRFRLESLNIALRSQVRIAGVGRVDFLIGDRLVIEVDSLAHHTDLASYHRDRERDLALAALGYERIRITYHQVMDRWDWVLSRILTIIRRRGHLARGRSSGAELAR